MQIVCNGYEILMQWKRNNYAKMQSILCKIAWKIAWKIAFRFLSPVKNGNQVPGAGTIWKSCRGYYKTFVRGECYLFREGEIHPRQGGLVYISKPFLQTNVRLMWYIYFSTIKTQLVISLHTNNHKTKHFTIIKSFIIKTNKTNKTNKITSITFIIPLTIHHIPLSLNKKIYS